MELSLPFKLDVLIDRATTFSSFCVGPLKSFLHLSDFDAKQYFLSFLCRVGFV